MSIVFHVFSGIFRSFSPVLARKISHSTKPAPSSPGLALETGQHCPSPVPPVRSPTSTPKPRAEGRVRAGGTQATSRPERERRPSPSAPAKKERQASACLSFFVVTGGEASARGACRGASERQWRSAASRPSRQARQVRPVISAMLWWRPPPPPDPFPGFLTRLHPSPTAATLSSTQNAPGFAFFGPNRVRFAVFVLF